MLFEPRPFRVQGFGSAGKRKRSDPWTIHRREVDPPLVLIVGFDMGTSLGRDGSQGR